MVDWVASFPVLFSSLQRDPSPPQGARRQAEDALAQAQPQGVGPRTSPLPGAAGHTLGIPSPGPDTGPWASHPGSSNGSAKKRKKESRRPTKGAAGNAAAALGAPGAHRGNTPGGGSAGSHRGALDSGESGTDAEGGQGPGTAGGEVAAGAGGGVGGLGGDKVLGAVPGGSQAVGPTPQRGPLSEEEWSRLAEQVGREEASLSRRVRELLLEVAAMKGEAAALCRPMEVGEMGALAERITTLPSNSLALVRRLVEAESGPDEALAHPRHAHGAPKEESSKLCINFDALVSSYPTLPVGTWELTSKGQTMYGVQGDGGEGNEQGIGLVGSPER